VPSFIEKALAEQSLPGLLANFKARAEKLNSGKAWSARAICRTRS